MHQPLMSALARNASGHSRMLPHSISELPATTIYNFYLMSFNRTVSSKEIGVSISLTHGKLCFLFFILYCINHWWHCMSLCPWFICKPICHEVPGWHYYVSLLSFIVMSTCSAPAILRVYHTLFCMSINMFSFHAFPLCLEPHSKSQFPCSTFVPGMEAQTCASLKVPPMRLHSHPPFLYYIYQGWRFSDWADSIPLPAMWEVPAPLCAHVA